MDESGLGILRGRFSFAPDRGAYFQKPGSPAFPMPLRPPSDEHSDREGDHGRAEGEDAGRGRTATRAPVQA